MKKQGLLQSRITSEVDKMSTFAESRQLSLRSMRGGAAIVVAIVLLVIAFIMALAITFSHQQESLTTIFYRFIAKDRHLAETGLELTLQKLNTDHNFSTEIENLVTGQRNPFDTQPAQGTINFEGGQITVTIEPFM
ncbi:MAG: hypothetical protein AB1765_04410 [Candidatus Hydrogenedentota bacterium]